MPAALKPNTEFERLNALLKYDILDTPAEETFDEITRLAAELIGVPIALVSLVDQHRQWFKSRVGLAAKETPRDWAFCAYTILQKDILEVEDALADMRFVDNPLVNDEPNIRFYAGFPLETTDGQRLGSLCVIDQKPRKLSNLERKTLATLGRQVMRQIELSYQVKRNYHLRKEAEERERAIQSMRSLFELSQDLISITNMDGRFVELNPAWSKLTGYSLQEMLTTPFLSFVHPDDHQKTVDEYAMLMTEQPKETQGFINRYITKSGEVIYLEWKASVDKANRLIYSVARDVTFKLKIQQQQLESQKRYQALVDSLSEGVVVHDRNGTIREFNQRALEILGVSEKQLKGVDSLHPQWKTIRLDGSPFPGEEHPAMVTLRNGKPQERIKMGVHRADGTLVWISINSVPLYFKESTAPEGVVVTFRDKTREVEDQKEIAKLALVAKHTSNGVLITDTEANIQWVNTGFENMSGYTLAEVKGRRPSAFLHGPNTSEKAKAKLRNAIRQQKSVQAELINYRKDGSEYWVSLAIQPIYSEWDKVIGYFSIQQEVTERIAYEESIRRQNEELRKANAELDNFVYKVSHDLRAPISSALGLLELAKKEENPDVLRELLDMKEQSMKRMDRFIHDILDYSRNSRLNVKTEKVLLYDLVDEILQDYAYVNTKFNVKSINDVPKSLEIIIDESRLKVVLNNLISNAIKYANPYIESSYVKVSAKKDEDGVVIEVSDNGLGIRKEHESQIFEMFF